VAGNTLVQQFSSNIFPKAMPQRTIVTEDRVRNAGSKAAKAYLDQIQQKVRALCPFGLECVFTGAVSDGAMTARTALTYEWKATCHDDEKEVEVTVRCDKALYEKALVPPSIWSNWFLAASLLKGLQEKGALSWMQENVQDEISIQHVALPKRASEPPTTAVIHQERGERIEYLLCARIEGDIWYGHPGTVNVKGSPLHPKDLAKVDLKRKWGTEEEKAKPTRRLKGRIQTSSVLKVAQGSPGEYNAIVSSALWMARANQETSNLEGMIADANLEVDPWYWEEVGDHVYLVWTRRSPDKWGATHHLSKVDLKSVLRELAL
jgi:hypothetical protein